MIRRFSILVRSFIGIICILKGNGTREIKIEEVKSMKREQREKNSERGKERGRGSIEGFIQEAG